ncbi:hypothetical protein Ddc_24087 [Ditylenchus destructor]|nr:hypothetical protein Ddc_24087 [Ditylenchus destructor]
MRVGNTGSGYGGFIGPMQKARSVSWAGLRDQWTHFAHDAVMLGGYHPARQAICDTTSAADRRHARHGRTAQAGSVAGPVEQAGGVQFQHAFVVLVQHRPGPGDDAQVGARGRRARALHTGFQPQLVAGAHRRAPAHFAQAGRAEGFGIVQRRVHRHAHGQRAGVPAAGDEAAPAALGGALDVGVEPLGIVLAGELENLGFGDGDRTGLDQHAVLEIGELHGWTSPRDAIGTAARGDGRALPCRFRVDGSRRQ